MTRKTKKKKIISDYRRRLQILEARERRNQVRLDEPVKQEDAQENKLSAQTNQIKRVVLSSLEREQLEKNTVYFARDLKKTLVLSVIGLGVIFGLYFFTFL
ncbi:MAG: hypothetical protein UU81_C0037G0008 [Microgenomates group bacterium GW2011_GWC1_41_8]|uniref:Uncharacterized protein n=2 Tax=Candidatus Roizmaniibacteriota TaxID=1752723 RepID=A0A0G0XBY9_9BACT|nr:MAG: hypothetical protein UU14_C0019G0006 [Candidatus Roizmanbacteria bacterium GW2011_GWB1_40_7]KKS22400.1 MAG: hypothetical protein UU78_C0017G0004 [Candidatus Roizmanbacteria bacterium GW2011_GWC2_41_7]KKS23220.1 MAG: hypothetical protein UU81_C0037G0008 [Microgenomates group bacterium GW2011_GWC1_41_8]